METAVKAPQPLEPPGDSLPSAGGAGVRELPEVLVTRRKGEDGGRRAMLSALPGKKQAQHWPSPPEASGFWEALLF